MTSGSSRHTTVGPLQVAPDRGRRRLLWLALAIWAGFILLEIMIDLGALPMAVIWAGHGLAMTFALKACLDRAPQRGTLRVVVYVAATIFVALVQTMLDLTTTLLLGEGLLRGMRDPVPGPIISPLRAPPLVVFQISLRSYLWIFGLYSAAVALQAMAQEELKAREERYVAQLKAQRAELDALRLHVNPHFLFNALNGLASLARAGKPAETEHLALRLARYYRESFVELDRDVLPLGDELENVQAYLELESHRLAKLSFEVDCPEALFSARVPAMILQPLVENAVKYGVAGHDDPAPVRITVREVNKTIEMVCESGLSPNPDQSGTGSGLNNVRRRLEKTFGGKASLTQERLETGWRTMIRMPRLDVFEADATGATTKA